MCFRGRTKKSSMFFLLCSREEKSENKISRKFSTAKFSRPDASLAAAENWGLLLEMKKKWNLGNSAKFRWNFVSGDMALRKLIPLDPLSFVQQNPTFLIIQEPQNPIPHWIQENLWKFAIFAVFCCVSKTRKCGKFMRAPRKNWPQANFAENPTENQRNCEISEKQQQKQNQTIRNFFLFFFSFGENFHALCDGISGAKINFANLLCKFGLKWNFESFYDFFFFENCNLLEILKF